MRPFLRRFALVAFGIFAGTSVPAQAQTPKQNQSPEIQVGTSYHNDLSPPLRDDRQSLAARAEKAGARSRAKIRKSITIMQMLRTLSDRIPSRQPFAAPTIPTPILNFDGIPSGVGGNFAPAEPDGAVGLSQYVQTAVEAYQVFDKATGASLLGPVNIALLWSGFSGVCEHARVGTPAVRYDHLANRWVISDLAGSAEPIYACIAVSTTSDATGSYRRYGFLLTGENNISYFNARLTVWPDAYYLSVDKFRV